MAATPWTGRRVLGYAHQGGSWEAPSSTVYALRAALGAGADALELDVHATSDGALVVCHDATLDRTTQGTGRIAEHSLAELKTLDNAYWFAPGADPRHDLGAEDYPLRGRAPEDGELGVATLREVLEGFPGVLLNLDIKETAPAVEAYEARLAALLAEFDRVDDVIVGSFHDAALDRFAAVAPDIATAAGPREVTGFWQAVQRRQRPERLRAVALQVPEQFGQLVVVDEAFVDAAHAAGLAVHVWTVNDEGAMERLVGLGVDGIMSDVPTLLSAVLGRLGVRWRPGGP
jgi:glycerophosphoryl diester phosphodiesterase